MPRSTPNPRRHFLGLLAAGAVAAPLLAAPGAAHAGKAPVYTGWGSLAVSGYDPVAYFTQKRPVKGSSKFSSDWNGATWRFSSAENKAAFDADPGRYAPQYGGYCAFAVSRGYTASTDPEAWSVVDGKLYLNYNKRVRSDWSKDIPGNIAKANKNWPGVLK